MKESSRHAWRRVQQVGCLVGRRRGNPVVGRDGKAASCPCGSHMLRAAWRPGKGWSELGYGAFCASATSSRAAGAESSDPVTRWSNPGLVLACIARCTITRSGQVNAEEAKSAVMRNGCQRGEHFEGCECTDGKRTCEAESSDSGSRSRKHSESWSVAGRNKPANRSVRKPPRGCETSRAEPVDRWYCLPDMGSGIPMGTGAALELSTAGRSRG